MHHNVVAHFFSPFFVGRMKCGSKPMLLGTDECLILNVGILGLKSPSRTWHCLIEATGFLLFQEVKKACFSLTSKGPHSCIYLIYLYANRRIKDLTTLTSERKVINFKPIFFFFFFFIWSEPIFFIFLIFLWTAKKVSSSSLSFSYWPIFFW